jgi:predicted lipid-binding transport protein (Tim44 family)
VIEAILMTLRFSRRSRATMALAAVLALAVAGAAEARPGGRSGGGFGSRGSRTFEAPAQTQTAPNVARPIERSQTQPGQIQQRPAPVPQAGVQQPARSRFGTGFFAGLLGAGLLGALFGAGFFGGLGGLASVLGFLLQAGLIVFLVMLAIRFFRRRQEPALAGARPGSDPGPAMRTGLGGIPGMGTPPAGSGLGGSPPVQARRSGVTDEVGIGPQDFDAFERGLVDVQTAYGREDVARLWDLATPEMASYLQEELNDNARQSVVNRIDNVKLLQGDLAEAWRDGDADYATVAMRYQLNDATVQKSTGRVVEGDPEKPSEVTEVWTYRRDRGGPWKLSAIQQVS